MKIIHIVVFAESSRTFEARSDGHASVDAPASNIGNLRLDGWIDIYPPASHEQILDVLMVK